MSDASIYLLPIHFSFLLHFSSFEVLNNPTRRSFADAVFYANPGLYFFERLSVLRDESVGKRENRKQRREQICKRRNSSFSFPV